MGMSVLGMTMPCSVLEMADAIDRFGIWLTVLRVMSTTGFMPFLFGSLHFVSARPRPERTGSHFWCAEALSPGV